MALNPAAGAKVPGERRRQFEIYSGLSIHHPAFVKVSKLLPWEVLSASSTMSLPPHPIPPCPQPEAVGDPGSDIQEPQSVLARLSPTLHQSSWLHPLFPDCRGKSLAPDAQGLLSPSDPIPIPTREFLHTLCTGWFMST